MQVASFVDEFLPWKEQIVVFGKAFIKNLPYSECAFGEDLGHVYPVLLALPGDVLLFFPFWELFDGFLDGLLEHPLAFIPGLHPFYEEIDNQDRIHLKIRVQIDSMRLLLRERIRLVVLLVLLRPPLILLHSPFLLLTSLLFLLEPLLKHRMFLLLTRIFTVVSHLFDKEIKFLNRVNRESFLQEL